MEKEKLTPFVINIEKETLNNVYYRNVIYTDEHSQTVLMSIPALEEIGLEKHTSTQATSVYRSK